MRAAQWIALFFLFAVTGLYLAAGRLAPATGGEDPAHPDRGTLAPLASPPPLPRIMGSLDPEGGSVVDLAVDGPDVAVLATQGWGLLSPDGFRGWFGDPTPGSPLWLDRPVSIALHQGTVFILDARRMILSVWDTLGVRAREIPLPQEATLSQRPTRVSLDPQGNPLVVVQVVNLDATASWNVLAMDSAGVLATLTRLESQAPSTTFQEPLLAPAGTHLLMADPLTQAFSTLDPESGEVAPFGRRQDPPLWVVPHRHREEYGALLDRMGGTMAALSALPEFWPSIRDMTVQDDGSILLVETAGEERVHLEILTPEGVPRGRGTLDGYLQPLFLSNGRAFIAEEEMDRTVIYEIVF